MSSEIVPLHKILKDETRRKIVNLLHEKGSLSYTELMNNLGIDSTGKINYHLRILNDLVVKREDGNYALSEKGMLASRLLTDFPEANRQQLGMKPKWWRRFWLGSIVFFVAFFAIYFVAYFLGYINSSKLYQNVVSLVFIIGFGYMIQHILRDVISKKTQLAIAKTIYIAIGVSLGIAVAFIGGGFAFVAISRLLDKPFAPGNPLYALFWSDWYLIFSILIAPTIGAIVSYRFGKKRRFRTQNYTPDL
jgi:DNA-binding transcriptional ArsR family regulator